MQRQVSAHAVGKILVGCGAGCAHGREDYSGVQRQVSAVGKILVGCAAPGVCACGGEDSSPPPG